MGSQGEYISRVFSGCLEEVIEDFQGHFRECQRHFKGFQGRFRVSQGVLGGFCGVFRAFREVSAEFQGVFGECKELSGSIHEVFRLFQRVLRCLRKFKWHLRPIDGNLWSFLEFQMDFRGFKGGVSREFRAFQRASEGFKYVLFRVFQ